MQRLVSVTLLFVLAGAASARDEVSLPVHDLLRRTSPSTREVPPVATHPAGMEGSYRRIAGESRLLASVGDEACQPWFDGPSLCTAVDALAGPDARQTEFDEKAGAVTCAPEDRDAVVRALVEIRARVPRPIALELTLERSVQKGTSLEVETLLAARCHADPARTIVIADAVEHGVVWDFDVEVAQASSMGDPIPAILRTGASAALCITPMPDGRSAIVEAVSRAAKPLEETQIDLGNPGFGHVDRCAVEFEEVAACLRVENGQTSATSWIGRDGSRMLLSVTATWTAPPAPGDPAIVVSPLFRSEFGGFRHVRGTDRPLEEEPESWDVLEQRTTSSEELVALAFHDPLYTALVRSAGSVMVLPASSSHNAAAQFDAFRIAAETHLKSARVECLVLNVPTGAVVSFDGAMPQGATTVAQFAGSAVVGLPVCTTGGSERRYLADWEVEVAQSARIPDPKFMSLPTGHFLNLIPREGSVDVDLELRRLDRMQRQEIQLAVGRVSQGVQGEKDEAPFTDPALPPETVAVEKPVVAQLQVVETVPLGEDGTGSLRRSAPSFLGSGRELVVLVRVK